MNPIETIATLLGIACVALAAQRSVWTFPCAIASVTLLGIVVFNARLYSDALLQLFFVAANLYGWANWSRAQAGAGEIAIERMSVASRVRWTLGGIAATVLWAGTMHAWTDAAYPWWDGAIAVASVAAQVLMGRRKVENWMIWIAIDLASIPLYLIKGLTMLAGLYAVYLALAIWGWIDWRRAMRREALGGAVAA